MIVPFLGAGCSVPPVAATDGSELALMLEHGAGSDGQALEDIAEEVWEQGDWQAFAQLIANAE
jgi:hypothetical protein